jgi:hypothetical protein
MNGNRATRIGTYHTNPRPKEAEITRATIGGGVEGHAGFWRLTLRKQTQPLGNESGAT